MLRIYELEDEEESKEEIKEELSTPSQQETKKTANGGDHSTGIPNYGDLSPDQ